MDGASKEGLGEVLTPKEAAELAVYEGRVAKGALKEGTAGFDRYLALVEKRDTGVAGVVPERGSVRFPTEGEAAEFYGFKLRGWLKLKALGREVGDVMPVDSPERMVAWFDRLRVMGKRKHRTPESVLMRAREAMVGGKVRVKPVSVVVEKEEEVVEEAILLGEEASTEDILGRYRRMSRALGELYERQLKELRVQDARDTAAQLDTVNEKIRQWSQSLKKIREGADYVHRESVLAAASVFFAGLWRLLQRELTGMFPAESERVLRKLAELEGRLPQLLPAEFKAGEAA